ncbi:MAG: hypothetical protein ACREDM_10225 [Methylocella sp.]
MEPSRRFGIALLDPRLVDLKTDPEIIEQFKDALREPLDAGRLHIELFRRVRKRASEPGRETTQITVYSEVVAVDEVVFATTGVKNQSRKPVREPAITYERSSGTIEIVGRIKTVREEIARLFAERLLGIELSGERLPPQRVDLSPLLDPHEFVVEPQEGIARVKLTMLTASTLGSSLTQRFDVPFVDD